MQWGGTDPLKAGVAPEAGGDLASGVSPEQERKPGIGGRRLPPYLAFRIDRFKRHKPTIADRPMTEFEWEQLQHK